jgi:hypothetical protein
LSCSGTVNGWLSGQFKTLMPACFCSTHFSIRDCTVTLPALNAPYTLFCVYFSTHDCYTPQLSLQFDSTDLSLSWDQGFMQAIFLETLVCMQGHQTLGVSRRVVGREAWNIPWMRGMWPVPPSPAHSGNATICQFSVYSSFIILLSVSE